MNKKTKLMNVFQATALIFGAVMFIGGLLLGSSYFVAFGIFFVVFTLVVTAFQNAGNFGGAR